MATPGADSILAEANNDNNEVASKLPPPTLASPTSPEDMKAIPNGTASSASVAESTTTVASTETAAVSTTTTTTTEEEEPVSTTTTGTSDAGGDVESSRASSATAASVFSEEQKAELRASFDECDKEKTGFISVGDLKSVVGTLGLNLDEDLIREMIDKFDLKRSGEIDFEEFVEMMASTTQGGPPLNAEEEIRQIFTVFDRNKTGFIDVDELRSVMKDLGENVSDEDIDAMMKEADVAGNGVISYDEFLLMFENSHGKYNEKEKTKDSKKRVLCCCS